MDLGTPPACADLPACAHRVAMAMAMVCAMGLLPLCAMCGACMQAQVVSLSAEVHELQAALHGAQEEATRLAAQVRCAGHAGPWHARIVIPRHLHSLLMLRLWSKMLRLWSKLLRLW